MGTDREADVPSSRLLLAAVERHQDHQLAHFESLDSKAGIALGFAGAIAALARDVQVVTAKIGLLLAAVAALFAMLSFRPRQLPVFDPFALRRYLGAEGRFTELRLLDTQIEMSLRASELVDAKALWLRLSLATLVASVGLLTAGTLLS